MKEVHFLLDEISEQDKKEVKDIIKRIKTKTQKTPKEVVFLRKFTLSLMKQYTIRKTVSKVIPVPNPFQLNSIMRNQPVPEQIMLIPKTEVPEQVQLTPKISISDIPEPIRLTEKRLEVPIPEPLRLADLHQAAPTPQVPTPPSNKTVTDAIKKELSIPMPTPN